jgi:5,5'-dehydrodivanillate O-demethylase oxygenase subunit
MLTQEQNERLTQVGAGTPMGELMRRYWHPIAAAVEMGKFPVRRRLLGEDLVVYRDKDGTYGALNPVCPHRGATLDLALVESGGVRCPYHGWKFNETGQCTEQPAEPAGSRFKDKVRTTAYPALEVGGLVWVYLGPQPAPLLPRYDLFVWDNCLRDVGVVTLPCNFLHIMENSVDPHHVEFLHGRFYDYVLGREPTFFTQHATKIGFDTFEWGIIKRRLVDGQTEESDSWKIGHPLVFPNILRVGGGGYYSFQIRVPEDDVTTKLYYYTVFKPLTEVQAPPQEQVPLYQIPLYDDKGDFRVDVIEVQDLAMWIVQGPIADRTKEKIGTSDVGIVKLRKLYETEMAKVEAGLDPMCVIRDPAANVEIELPQERHAFGSAADFLKTVLHGGLINYSPLLDDVIALFTEADNAAAGRSPAFAGGTPGLADEPHSPDGEY